VKDGAHIAALGADLKGEQELDPKILQRGRVFVDDIRQCREDGEICGKSARTGNSRGLRVGVECRSDASRDCLWRKPRPDLGRGIG
jgi:hypothetical protein